MKTLVFYHRGEKYEVNENGEIKNQMSNKFSKTWIFLGGSSHHWHNRVTVSLKMAFENPELLNGCLGWDTDHGTLRQWAGQWCGRLPRISGAHIAHAV